MIVTFQSATPSDRDFVFEVTKETMREYVEQQFGAWDDDWQRRHSDEAFDPLTYRLIIVDGKQAGLLVVEDGAEETVLAKIYLRTAFQRRGIGTLLLTQLIGRAHCAQKLLRLRVLRVNPARALYERLGFVVTESVGYQHHMEYRQAQ